MGNSKQTINFVSGKIIMGLEIDIEQIIRDRSPKGAKWIPRPLFGWLKRLIRQREINDVLRKYGHREGTAFIEAVLDEWGYHPQVHLAAPIDPEKKYIFASNHPLGGIDGLILAAEIERRFGPVKIMVNDLLMHLAPVRSLFVPVNKYGKQSADYARELDKMYRSADQVLLFPAGLCSRKISAQVQDIGWKKNVITKAVQYQRDIIPIFFDAQNSKAFYRTASLRQAIGLKFNLELVLLPGEMFRQPNKNMSIYFGRPIPFQTFTREKRPEEWAAWLREQAYTLKQNNTP
ncbi:MAG: 1-acyl-sn-glycerol-3-phosphate acyltransferase [Rikenellaceae bacterium]|nr:1-acyl-sn-glycerol-3-phosphate acyltransferase [Rikenellaceae bacterium]